MKKRNCFFLLLALLLLFCPKETISAKGKTALSAAKLTVTEGDTAALKLKNNKQKVTWSVLSGKKNITLQAKTKKGVRIVAKKQGTAKVQAKIGKRSYICKVKIKENAATQLEIQIDGKKFKAELSDTAAAKALTEQLPLNITMKELNGNEKYDNLETALPVKETASRQINAGDIMLYGSDCLVFFYKSFQTSYRYTRIGKILDPAAFAEAVGAGNVDVVIQIG